MAAGTRQFVETLALLILAAGFSACGAAATLPVSAGTSPDPVLPPLETSLLPLVNTVTARPWSAGQTPAAADGTRVAAFARDLDHPRWLYVLPNGDVLVVGTNAPERPDDNRGVKGWFFNFFQARAGGMTPSANRIRLLRDVTSPFGIALVGDAPYIAFTDAVVRFPYSPGITQIRVAGASRRARQRPRARLPDIRSQGRLPWLAVQLLRSEHRHARSAPRPDLVATALKPDYALGPHTASLGLAYAKMSALRVRFQQEMFVGQHGSWNREPRSGYKVIFVPFADGMASGAPIDLLTGFVDADGNSMGRPVGVAIDATGAVLVADDVGNTIWRVEGFETAPDSTEVTPDAETRPGEVRDRRATAARSID